jgi:hypothetical protein
LCGENQQEYPDLQTKNTQLISDKPKLHIAVAIYTEHFLWLLHLPYSNGVRAKLTTHKNRSEFCVDRADGPQHFAAFWISYLGASRMKQEFKFKESNWAFSSLKMLPYPLVHPQIRGHQLILKLSKDATHP